MAWPTASEIGIAARLTLTDTESGFTTSYDYNVSVLLERVIAELAAYCKRPDGFDQATLTQTFDGGRRILKVRNPPIISVTSVSDNTTDPATVLDVDDDEYYVYTNYVKLPRPTDSVRLREQDRTPQRYTIIYVGGYDDAGTPLPGDLVDVCAEMATRILLRVDDQYRIYRNVDSFNDGQIESVFPNKEKAFSDLYARLSNNGHVKRVTR